jgi:hypothetical protein
MSLVLPPFNATPHPLASPAPTATPPFYPFAPLASIPAPIAEPPFPPLLLLVPDSPLTLPPFIAFLPFPPLTKSCQMFPPIAEFKAHNNIAIMIAGIIPLTELDEQLDCAARTN